MGIWEYKLSQKARRGLLVGYALSFVWHATSIPIVAVVSPPISSRYNRYDNRWSPESVDYFYYVPVNALFYTGSGLALVSCFFAFVVLQKPKLGGLHVVVAVGCLSAITMFITSLALALASWCIQYPNWVRCRIWVSAVFDGVSLAVSVGMLVFPCKALHQVRLRQQLARRQLALAKQQKEQKLQELLDTFSTLVPTASTLEMASLPATQSSSVQTVPLQNMTDAASSAAGDSNKTALSDVESSTAPSQSVVQSSIGYTVPSVQNRSNEPTTSAVRPREVSVRDEGFAEQFQFQMNTLGELLSLLHKESENTFSTSSESTFSTSKRVRKGVLIFCVLSLLFFVASIIVAAVVTGGRLLYSVYHYFFFAGSGFAIISTAFTLTAIGLPGVGGFHVVAVVLHLLAAILFSVSLVGPLSMNCPLSQISCGGGPVVVAFSAVSFALSVGMVSFHSYILHQRQLAKRQKRRRVQDLLTTFTSLNSAAAVPQRSLTSALTGGQHSTVSSTTAPSQHSLHHTPHNNETSPSSVTATAAATITTSPPVEEESRSNETSAVITRRVGEHLQFQTQSMAEIHSDLRMIKNILFSRQP